MSIKLYIKTHLVTGLKYFGMTRKVNVNKYRGSGKYWLLHIKKHGYSVDTQIIKIFDNVEEAADFAISFSKENNILKSENWANLMIENCSGGGTPSKEIREKMSKTRKGKPSPLKGKKRPDLSDKLKNRLISKETCEKISENHADVSGNNNPMYGKQRTEKWRKDHSIKMKGNKNCLGRVLSEETIKKIGEGSKKKWTPEMKTRMIETRKLNKSLKENRNT